LGPRLAVAILDQRRDEPLVDEEIGEESCGGRPVPHIDADRESAGDAGYGHRVIGGRHPHQRREGRGRRQRHAGHSRSRRVRLEPEVLVDREDAREPVTRHREAGAALAGLRRNPERQRQGFDSVGPEVALAGEPACDEGGADRRRFRRIGMDERSRRVVGVGRQSPRGILRP
jgi:hypothetical protein